MRFSVSLLNSALFVSIAFLSSAACGQNQFFGQDQTVNRVIKLRSSDMVQKAADKVASETSRLESSARKTFSNPAQIKFEDIKKVPPTLMQQQEPPKVMKQNQNGFAAPALIRDTPTNKTPQVSKSWNFTPPQSPMKTGPLTPNMSSGVGSNINNRVNDDGISVQAANNIQTKIRLPKFVNVNQPAQMNIALENQGKSPVQNVTLLATIPAHVKLTNASPKPIGNDGQVYKFSIPQISSLSTRQVELTLVPTKKTAIDVATVVRVESTSRTSVAVRQPEISISLGGPRQANIGQKVTHELVVANVGDGVATDVRLDTMLPSQLKLIKQSSGPFIRTIEPGKSTKITFESVAQAPGETQLKAAAEAIGCDPKKTDFSFAVYQPELRVTASGPKLNFVERDGIYTINIENTGVVDVTDTRISLRVPQGMKVNTISRQAGVDSDEGVLTWKFDRIASKSSEQIQLKATALKEGTQNCAILVSSNETRDKEISLLTQVITRADLSVQIANVTGPVQVGAKAEFVVTVENKGSRRASDVGIQIALPDSLMPVKNNDISQNKSLLFQEPQIAPGQKATFKFAAVGVTSGEHVVRSVLQTQGSERKVIAEDTVYVYEVDQTRVSEAISPVIPR